MHCLLTRTEKCWQWQKGMFWCWIRLL